MNKYSKATLLTSCLLAPNALLAQSAESRPNVVFIICDDLNDYSGAFGGHPDVHTPNIDRMAREGIQFVNAQTNIPVSQPSRNSLFTGVYPHESCDFGWIKRTKQPVLKNNRTFISLFRDAGYATYGTGKLLHSNEKGLWNRWGMNEGDNYGPYVVEDGTPVAHRGVPEPYHSIGPIDGSFGPLDADQKWIYGWGKKPMRYVSDDDRAPMQDELHVKWAKKAIEEHAATNGDKPFFLGVGFVRPHTPLHAPQKYFDQYPLDKIELSKWLKNDELDTYLNSIHLKDDKGYRYYRELLKSYNGDRELALKSFLQAYLACISFVDDQIGAVVDAVKSSPYADNTIIVLTSDHGWQMGEKNFLFKNSPWEESCRIPMVWQVPNGDQGKIVKQPVSLVDIYPTLQDLCALGNKTKLNDRAGKLGGHTMRPLIYDNAGQWEGYSGALTIVGNIGVTSTIDEQCFSYRTERWRYIVYENGQEELYDHSKDEYEWHNIAKKRSSKRVIKKLRAELSQIVEDRF